MDGRECVREGVRVREKRERGGEGKKLVPAHAVFIGGKLVAEPYFEAAVAVDCHRPL